MGQKASKQHQVIDASEVMKKRHKIPIDVVVDRPKLAERAGKPVLNIPNSTYRVLYIDPAQRADVVARHGYIALRTDGIRVEGEDEEEKEDAVPGDTDHDALEKALPGRRRRDSEISIDVATVNPPSNLTSGMHDDLDVDSDDGAADKDVPASKPQSAGKDQFGGSGVKRRASGTGGRSNTMDRTSKHQQFIYPVGRYAQTKVYFEDARYPEDFDQEHDGNDEAIYEHEEDEICEMAGVPRIMPRPFEPTEADLTYELSSKVLDALRMAIDAPMEKFRIDRSDEDKLLAEFRAQAMEQMALVRDPFADAAGEQEVFVIAAPTIDHQMTREEAENKQKVKRRKKLHKEVNAWRSEFERVNGRKPTSEEMHADPDFGPLYRDYLALKKETRDETSASPGYAGGPEITDDPFAQPGEEGVAAPAALTKTATAAPAALAAAAAAPRHLQPVGAEPLAPAAAAAAKTQQMAVGGATGKYRALPIDKKAHVKHLVKTMRNWKQEFVGIHGIPATRADIVQDPVVSDVYLELRKTLGDDDADITDDEAVVQQVKAAASAAQTPAPTPISNVPLWRTRHENMTMEEKYERRRELGRQLNTWKSQFAEAEGRKPNAADIAADAMISLLYEEYAALPKPEDTPLRQDEQPAQDVKPSVSPPFAAESPEAEKAMAKRRKALGKELNGWKLQWAAEHDGEPPTQEDVDNDPTISAIYQEYRSLPSKKDRSNSVTRDEDSPQATDRSNTPQSTPAHSKRRKQLGRQLTAWKAQWAEDHGGEPPTHADLESNTEIAAIYAEYKALGAARRDSRAMSLATGSLSTERIPMVMMDQSAAADDPSKRRKALGKTLNAWKAQWAEQHGGEPPTHADLEGDPEIAGVYAEYKALGAARRESRQLDSALGGASDSQPRQRRSSSVRPGVLGEVSASKRRKQLAKELNAWKAKFEEAMERVPTVDDMLADPNIRVLYEEYKQLKESSSTADGTASTGSELLPTQNGAAINDDDAVVNVGARSESAMATSIPPAEGVPQTTTPNPTSTAKRRKALGKELNAWKAAFLEANGRKPTAEDIAATPEIQAKYDEYTTLKDGGAGGDGADAGGDAQAPSAAAAEEDSDALHKRRKKLGKQLNDWKKAYFEREGRHPTAADIEADPEVKALFDEYQSIPKQGSATATTAGTTQDGGSKGAPTESGAGADEEADEAAQQQAAADKARKKMLAQQLNMWKEVFADENGRPPKTEDILADPDIAPVYEEYLTLKNKL